MEHPLKRPELLTCAWRGHVLPGAEIDTLDARHAVLARDTEDGRRLVQCLRCADWVLVDPPVPGTGTHVESPADVDRPRRGKALRQAIVLRLIAVDKAVHAVAFAAVSVAAMVLDQRIDALHSWAESVRTALDSADKGSGGASSHGLFASLLERLSHLNGHSLAVIATFAAVYAIVSSFEAVGLWLERRWAEYLTALATAGFLPLEIHELTKRVTFVRVLALVVNLAILAYLVFAKHLFGVGGPLPEPESSPLEPLPELVKPAAVPS